MKLVDNVSLRTQKYDLIRTEAYAGDRWGIPHL